MIILNPNGAHPKAFEKLPVVLGAWYLVTVSAAGPACEEGGKAHPPAQATAGAGFPAFVAAPFGASPFRQSSSRK